MSNQEPIPDYRLSRVIKLNGLPTLMERLDDEARPYILRVRKRDVCNIKNGTVDISLMTDSVDKVMYFDELIEDLRPDYDNASTR